MNTKIYLGKILENKKANRSQVAALLFPGRKFPDRALLRIIEDDKAELSSSQVAMLANHLGVNVSELYEPDSFRIDGIDEGTITFLCEKEFLVKVSKENWKAEIYYKNKPVVKDIQFSGDTRLSAMVEEVKEIIQEWMDLV